MKVRNSISFFAIAALIFSGSVLFTSCSDPVKGCTDPNAENYNADADESDATLCVYARDKFIGDYAGSLICPSGLINQPEYNYKISEKAGGTADEVTITITVMGAPVAVSGKVSGNTITLDQSLSNLPFTLPTGTTAVVNIKVTGTVNIANEKTLSGNLLLAIALAANNAPLGTDSCPITGTKL